MATQYLKVSTDTITPNQFFGLLGNSANLIYQLQYGHLLGELEPNYPDTNNLSYLFAPPGPTERTFLITGIDTRRHIWIAVNRDGLPPDVISALDTYTCNQERYKVTPRIVTINDIMQIATFDMYDMALREPHH